MAKRVTARSFLDSRQNSAQNFANTYGVDQWTQRQYDLQQSADDFNNYLNSGNYTTDNNKKYRDMATQAVADLDAEMKRYGTNSNEYKTLKGYKNYYESQIPNLNRMDVSANVRGYLDYDPDTYEWKNWHTQDDYNLQKTYLDEQRSALQAEIDAAQKKMEKEGEYYSPDLEDLKAWMEQYDQMADALEKRNEYDKGFPDLEHYTAYSKSDDYKYSTDLENTVAAKTEELKQKNDELTFLEAKFGAGSHDLGVLLGNALAGQTGGASTGSAIRQDPEGYQHMLDLKKEVEQLRKDIEAAQGDLDMVHSYQGQTIERNFGGWDPKKNWEKEVGKLKDAYRLAEEGSTEQAKIAAQIRTLAGENWDGTDAKGLYDDNNYLGRWYLQNIDVEGDKKKYKEIEDQLKAMGAPTTAGGGWLLKAGLALGGGATPGGADVGSAVETVNDIENNPEVIRLRADKKRLNQNLESAAKYQNRAAMGESYGKLGEEQQAAFAEAGKAAVAEDGKSYKNAKGQSVSLKNFEALLDDETDPGLRDMVYAAIGAELAGADIGYSVADIMDAYSERMAQYAGYKAAKKRSEIKNDFARWITQVPGQGTVSGLNQAWTGARQLFSDDAVENNKAFYAGQYTREDLKRYGDEQLFVGSEVGGSNISQLLYDTAQTTGNMLPMIVASSLLTAAGAPEAAAAAVGAGVMGLTSAGNTYQQALNEGWEKNDARLFAAITGAAEGGLQYAIGGITGLGGVGEEQLLAMAGRINDAAVRAATKTAIHIGSEVTEELIQNRIERYLRWQFNGENGNLAECLKWTEDDWYTVLVTALSTGMLEGPGAIHSEIRATKAGNAISGNVIPSKGFTKGQQQRNALMRRVGETMQGDAATKDSLIAFATDPELIEVGGQANLIAEKMKAGKMEMNATNLGWLYSEILSEYGQKGGEGVQAAMAGIIGGGVRYHLVQNELTGKSAAEAQIAEVKKANPGAEVLDVNASELMKFGVKEKAAKEYAVILNKIMSGTDLSSAEMSKLLDESTAGEASLALLRRLAEYRETDMKLRLDKASVEEGIGEMVQQFRRRKAEQKATAEASITEAQRAAVAGSLVSEAAEGATAPKTFYAAQDLVDPAAVETMRKAESDIESADARLEQIKNTPSKTLGNAKMLEDISEEHAGTVNSVIENRTLNNLRDQLDPLKERASKLAAIKFPSRAQMAELADVRQQISDINDQIRKINVARAERAVARINETEAAARSEESAELARNSSDSVDTIVLPGSGQTWTREQYVNDAVNTARKDNPKITAEQIEQVKAKANEDFNTLAEQSGGKVTENGRNESSSSEGERNDVGDTANGGEDRQRSSETRSDDRGAEAGGTELFAADSLNGAAYASKDATVTDGDHLDLLEKKHPGLKRKTQQLKKSGFTNIRYVTNGELYVVDKDTGAKQVAAAIVRGTELVLNLDVNNWEATAEHERTHLRLRLLRKSLGEHGEEETRAFVTSSLQNILGRDVYINAFMKYLAEYGPVYSHNGKVDPMKVGHLINEEMFCDMAAGLNCWGTGLGEFSADLNGRLAESKFDAVTEALANGENPTDLVSEETEPNAMPFGLQMQEKLNLADPFRHDVDTSRPPEARPTPGEEPMHEEQQLMSIQSFTEATGLRLERNVIGQPYAVYDKDGNRVTHVTPDMMVNTPIGQLVGDAVRRVVKNEDGSETVVGHISEAAAQRQYKMLADVMNLILDYNDAAMVWEIVGSQLFSGVKANSDKQYNLTIDFGTICRKTQAIVDAMSETMKQLGRGLSRREVEAVYLETGLATDPETGEHVATPCPVCYVFSRWMGIGGLLDDINNFQNSLFNINQKNGEFTWREGQEQEALKLMSEVEQAAREFYDALPADKISEYTDKKTGEMLLGKVLSDMKNKPNSNYESGLQKLNMHQQAVGTFDKFLKLMPTATPEKLNTYVKLLKSVKGNIIRQSDTDAIVARVQELASRVDPKSAEGKAYKELLKALQAPRKTADIYAQVEQDMADAKKDLLPYDIYQWLTSTVFKSVPNDEFNTDGTTGYHWERNELYRPVVKDILFDLNRGADFAQQYPLTWGFRTGKGCAMGKAIMPYSDARVGETIQGVASGNVKDIKISNEKNGDINAFLNGDTTTRAKILQKAIENMRRQNLIGGMRLQSTSDFRFEWGSDYLITFFELQAMGANVQLYTKVLEAVDFLASTNSDINISVMPLGNGVETYVDPKTGETKKRLAFSDVTGVNGDAAIEKAHQYDNVQLILVGINDENIRLALEGTDVTFVIPFHGSGQSVHQVQSLMDLLGENLDVTTARDYSAVQSDHAIPGRAEKFPELQAAWDLRMSIIMGEFWDAEKKQIKKMDPKQQAILKKNKHLQKLYNMFYEKTDDKAYHCFLAKDQAEQIFPYEYWDTTTTYATADRNGEIFKDYCKSLGVIPRFSGLNGKGERVFYEGKDANGKKYKEYYGDFSNDKGYWKLLIDRKMYNNTYDDNGNWNGYGTYRDQKKVTTTNIRVGTLDTGEDVGLGDLDENQIRPKLPERARSKKLNSRLTPTIVENSINRIDAMHAKKDTFDLTKVTKGFRNNMMKINRELKSNPEAKALLEEERKVQPVEAPERKDTVYDLAEATERLASRRAPAEQDRMSLQNLDYDIEPTSDKWQRDRTVAEVKAEHPGLWRKQESGQRDPTQVKDTVKTYRKIYQKLADEGFDGTILDASSGWGVGTQAGRDEFGFNVEDIEPFPDKTYEPMYTDYDSLDKTYDAIISNAVLNVLPQDQRDALIVKMGQMLKPGGKMYINVRGDDVNGNKSNVPLGGKWEYYVENTGSYQKGFTKPELKAYVEDALGDGYTVRIDNSFGKSAVVVTKDGGQQKTTRPVIPAKGANLTESRGRVYNENEQQRFSKQGSDNNGRASQAVVARSGNDVDTRNERRLADQLNKLLSEGNWAGSHIEAARRGDSGIAAKTAWRDDERRQRRVIDFAADFLEHHNYQGIRVDRAENAKGNRLFEYGVSDFLDYIFDTMARDPQGLMLDLQAHMKNADAFIEGLNKAMELDEEPNYRRSFYNWTKADEDYMDAIERNDVAKLREIVTKAARKAGYKGEFYQHTPIRFEEFSRGEFGFHIGSMTQAATIIYNKMLQRWNHGDYKENPHAFIPLFAKITNPYVLPKVDRGSGKLTNDYNVWYPHEIAEYLKDTGDFDEYSDELQTIIDGPVNDEYDSPSRKLLSAILEAKGYDALQYTNAAEGNKKRDSGTAYIIWNPEQLKSADLITYDEKGNVIPISERFDKSNPEYRYSMQDENATVSNPWPKDTLMGDMMDHILNGSVEDMENYINRELNKYNTKKEQAKVIPPRVPSRDFVPKVTEREKAALEKERLDRIGLYGSHRPSDQRVSDDYVLPKKDREGRGQKKFYQNAGSAVNVLNEPARDVIKREALTSELATYDFDTNAADLKFVKNKIENRGYEYCLNQFLEQAEDMSWKGYGDESITKVIAMGQQLMAEASANGTYRDLIEVVASLALLSDQAGKALQAFQMLKKTGPMGQLYYVQKAVNQLNNKQYAKLIESKKMPAIKVDPELEKAVVLAKTDAERETAMNELIASIAKQVPPTLKDKWDTWRHFAMLGNFRTHIRNIFGNAIFVPLRFASDLMSAAGESIAVKAGLMKESERIKSVRISRELRDFAKQDAETMRRELQGGGKYNPAQEILDKRQIFKWKWLDDVVKANSNGVKGSKLFVGLEGEDWWFLAPAYEKALGMVLMHSGYSVDEMLGGKNKEAAKELNRARRIAIEAAQRATYRDFSVSAAALNRLKRGGGVGGILLEGVLPFTKTPINILKRGIEYSPAGIATALYGLAKDYSTGSIDAAKFIERLSAGLTGTGVAILGALLAKLGWLRGKKDDKEEDFDKLQGYQDYSLQIGDVSMTIDWAAPTALPLFTGVAAWDMMKNDEELTPADIFDAILLVAEPMMSLSMLDGLNRTLSAASYAGENEKIPSITTAALTSYVGQGIPTILGQVARSLDGTRRQTYVDKNSPVPSAMQRFVQGSVQNKIPVWEAHKAPYVDQWGREDTGTSKILGAFENFLSPSYVNLVHTTDIDEEIDRLYAATKERAVLPSSPGKDVRGRYLSADEYTAYAKDVGTTKYNLLAQLFADPRYMALGNDQKLAAVKKIYEYAGAAGKYHVDPEYDIRKNGGVWCQEAEAMPNDLLRYNRIWEAIENALKD